jgi:hypothetical protein
MAIAYDTSTDGGNNGGANGTLSWSHTTSGSDRLLIVTLFGDSDGGADDISSITYNSVGLTLLAKRTDAGLFRAMYVYYLLNPASGANNVVVTAGSTHYLGAGAASYTGVGSLDTFVSTFSNADADGSLSQNITTGGANAWLIGGFFGSSGFAAVADAGIASVRRTDANFLIWNIADSNGPIVSPGSQTVTWHLGSGSTGDMVHIVGSFLPAGAGGSTPSPAAGTLSLAGTTGYLGFAIHMPDEL